jgi:uncharacterized phage protein (TIGR02220 family)
MAAPQKEGLEYFPVDVDMAQDDKIYMIEVECGLEGFGLLMKLLMKVYKNSYYLDWNEKTAKIFAHKNSVDVNVINNLIQSALENKVFNEEKYEQYNILTSTGIQKRYFKATVRRKDVEYNTEYILINVDKYNNLIEVSGVNVDNNSKSGKVNVNKSTQSKEQYSIEENSIEENSIEKELSNSCPTEKKQDIPYKEIVNYLNQRTGSQYRSSTQKTKRLIRARWNEGFMLEDFETVIDKKCVEWMGDEEMEKYLRPPTLFGTKFESYLNQLSVKNSSQSKEDRQNDMMRDLYQEYKEEEEEE